MKNDGWVKWYQYGSTGLVNHGQMRMEDVADNLKRFEKNAMEILNEFGPDHVVYGLKVYAEDGTVDCIKFYDLPVNDEEYEKDIATLKNCIVYAVHKRS